jgi:RNAse (barnase) inhibitor barstar
MSAVTIEAKRSGVYCAPAQIDVLQNAAVKAGMVWIDLPLKAVANKKQFLAMCAKQLKLPSYFGGNWDALADCLCDFNWLPGKGYVLHIAGAEKFVKAADDDYRSALDVLSAAADYWKGRGTPFIVLVDGVKDLPAF